MYGNPNDFLSSLSFAKGVMITNMKPKILTFGEIIWDIYETEKLIGGAGLNFAAHCERCGAESFLFSSVGNDDLGKSASDIIDSFGIDSRFVKKSANKTGQCIVRLNEKGIADFNVLTDTAFDNIEVTDNDIAEINKIKFDVLCFGTLIQRGNVSRQSLRRLCEKCTFSEIVCDVNLRKGCYDADSAEFCLKNATILKISNEEEPLLKALKLYDTANNSEESIAQAICKKYTQIKYLIFTLGEKGAYVYSAKDGTGFYQDGKSVKVNSTVGAGDSFTAAWITSLMQGETVKKATETAIKLSSFVVSKADAIPHYKISGGIINE